MLKKGTFLSTAAAALAFGMIACAPQPAAAYDSVLAPPSGGTPSKAAAPSSDSTYGGVISPAPRAANNPYQPQPADNLYDFVAKGGDATPASIEEARRKATDMRRARQREMQKQQAERQQQQRAEWARMREEMKQKQQELMEQARQNGALPYTGNR